MPDSVSRGWNYLEERFGVGKNELDNYRLRERSGDLWLVSDAMNTSLEIETHGIRFIRILDIGLKPTTYGLQLLGDRIEKNTVELNKEELGKLMGREEMVKRELNSEGYVALKYGGRIIGCGFYRDGKVSSRVPKGRGEELREILES